MGLDGLLVIAFHFFTFVFRTFFQLFVLRADSSAGATTRQAEHTTYTSQRRTSPPSLGSKGRETLTAALTNAVLLYLRDAVASQRCRSRMLPMSLVCNEGSDRQHSSRGHHFFGQPTSDVFIGQVVTFHWVGVVSLAGFVNHTVVSGKTTPNPSHFSDMIFDLVGMGALMVVLTCGRAS